MLGGVLYAFALFLRNNIASILTLSSSDLTLPTSTLRPLRLSYYSLSVLSLEYDYPACSHMAMLLSPFLVPYSHPCTLLIVVRLPFLYTSIQHILLNTTLHRMPYITPSNPPSVTINCLDCVIGLEH